MSGTPSLLKIATGRRLHLSQLRVFAPYRGFHRHLQLRVSPPRFTLAPSVARLGRDAPPRAVQTARLLQAAGSVPATFAVPFCTRPDPGEDDFFYVIGLSFASWRTFSCKGRGFCPSCGGRRMAAGAANLVDHVLPEHVPIRQWVLTLSCPLQFPLAFDGGLLGQVLRIFTDTVGTWYRKRQSTEGAHLGQCGAVTPLQRASSDLFQQTRDARG